LELYELARITGRRDGGCVHGFEKQEHERGDARPAGGEMSATRTATADSERAILTRLRLAPEQAAFRDEVREFLRNEMSPEHVRGHADARDLTGLDIEFERAHHLRAGKRGFLGIALPVEYGGGGKSPTWKAIYDFEAAYHDAPSIDTAVTLCAAPILRFGSEAQRASLLPRMARGEITGCAAYSERDAGSDLAALTASAQYADGRWRLRGDKALITGAHKADVCITLVRTEAGGVPLREALSMFAVPLPHAGVTITRRATANQWTLSEIQFNDAELADDALIGQRGAGWSQMLATFADEPPGFAWLGWATRLTGMLLERFDDPRVAQLVVELGVARRFCERALAMREAGRPVTYEGSMAKVYVTELLQRIARTGADLEGAEGLRWSPLFQGGSRFSYELLERIHCTISVGANEVQRDVIGRVALKLPRS